MGLQKPKLLLKNRNNVHAAVINTPGSLSPNCLAWDAAALLLPSKEPGPLEGSPIAPPQPAGG